MTDDLVRELAQAMCDTENKRRARAMTNWPEVSIRSFYRDATAAVPVVEARVAAERERIEAALIEFVLEYYGISDLTSLDMIPIRAMWFEDIIEIVRSDGVTDDE